jgi:hypothetical protein
MNKKLTKSDGIIVDIEKLLSDVETYKKDAEQQLQEKQEAAKSGDLDIRKLEDERLKTKRIVTTSAFVHALSKSTLKNLVSSSKEYKVIQEQIHLIEQEKDYFKDDSKYLETLKELKNILARYTQITDYNDFEEIKERSEIMKNSEELKENKRKYEETRKELMKIIPKQIIKKIRELRKYMQVVENEIVDIKDVIENNEYVTQSSVIKEAEKNLMDTDEAITEIEDMIENVSETVDITKAPREKILELINDQYIFIASMTGIPVPELKQMKVAPIERALENSPAIIDKLQAIKKSLEKLEEERRIISSSIAPDKLSEMIFNNPDMFDIETEKGTMNAKSLLASSKSQFVFRMASVFAFNYGLTDEEDIKDIYGAGTLALMEIFETWKTDQIKSDKPINFDIYINANLYGKMTKAAAAIKGGGTIKPSNYITRHSVEKKALDKFIKDNTQNGQNQELKYMDYGQLTVVYMNAVNDPELGYIVDKADLRRFGIKDLVTRESSYNSGSTQDTGDSGMDTYFHSLVQKHSTGTDERYLTTETEVDEFISNFKIVYSLKAGSKKLFDSIDIMIMLLRKGIFHISEDRITEKKGGKNLITDNIISQELNMFGIQISAPSLSERIKKMERTLKILVKNKINSPDIKDQETVDAIRSVLNLAEITPRLAGRAWTQLFKFANDAKDKEKKRKEPNYQTAYNFNMARSMQNLPPLSWNLGNNPFDTYESMEQWVELEPQLQLRPTKSF